MKSEKALKGASMRRKNDAGTLHLMLLPAVILVFIYHYIPIGGLVMAFQNYL